jgi:serine/threonine-protein kinase
MAVLSRRFLESRMWGHMSTTDLPGSSLLANRYRLVERLGAGGMSVVWRGFDEVLGRQVAVKVLPPSTSADPSFRRRLRAEAQAAARLSHPNITNVYDYGEATTVDGEPVPYVVMELVDGESLAAVLARVRRLPWPAAVRICSEVSAALAAAHARGIVHRDVTPANVMLTSAGAKVVDFGISALIGENDIDPDGSLLGTPAYLAPERLEGGQVSPATDVYAVGLLIYRTLIGQLPWDVGTTTALLRAHQYTEPEPLPPVEGLPAAVSALVERCLEKRPDDRPSSADLAHVLAGIAAGSPAGRGYVPDWAENGEDTTILPSPHADTDGIGRIRPGHAQVADSAPVQAGRGVAAVRACAEGPAGLAAAAAAMAAAAENAPVSPAPGTAMPVSVSDVKAAVAGEPVGNARVPQAPLTGNSRGPGQASVRNNRFGPLPQAMAAGGAGGAALDPAATGLRPAYSGPPSPADRSVSPEPGAGGGAPPHENPPASPGGSGLGGSKRPRSANSRRRVLIVAGAVALLGVAIYAFSLAVVPGGGDKKGPGLPVPTVLAASGKCVVSYAVHTDQDNRFQATVTVANRDNRAIKNWTLWFLMQGDQVVSGAGEAKLDQQGTAVTIDSDEVLSPQKSKTMKITGRYELSNAAPMVFQLAGESCETYVSGKPGEPSRPVQRLSDGKVRLGPPAKDNPAPGISTGPDGVVIIVLESTKPTKTTTPPIVVSETPTADAFCDLFPDDPKCGLAPTPNQPPPTSTTSTTDPPESTPPTEGPVDPDPEDTGVGAGDGGNPLPPVNP